MKHTGRDLDLLFSSALEGIKDLLNLDLPLISVSVLQSTDELRQTPLPKLVVQVIRVLLSRSSDHQWLRGSLRLPLQKLK